MKPKTRTYLVTAAKMFAWLLGILVPGPILLIVGFDSAPKGYEDAWVAVGFGLRFLGTVYIVFSLVLALLTLFNYQEEFEAIKRNYESYVRENKPSWDYDEDEERTSKSDSVRLYYLEKEFEQFKNEVCGYFKLIMLALFFIVLMILFGVAVICAQNLGIPDWISAMFIVSPD